MKLARAPRKSKSKTVRKIDMSEEVKYFGVDEDVELVVKKAEWEEGDAGPYIAIEFGGVDDYDEAVLYHNASASPKALGRFRALMEALGIELPETGEVEVDTDDLIDLHVMGHTYEDVSTYDGKTRKSVKAEDFWPVDEKASKKGAKKDDKKKSSKKAKEPELLERDAVEAMDRDELTELINEHELEVDPDTRKLKKDDEALLAAVIEALEEKELIEEEKKPAKGKAGSKSSSKKSSKKSESWSEDQIQDMSEEELQEVIDAAEIEVDLDDFPTLRKKKNAVVDALSEAEKLDA